MSNNNDVMKFMSPLLAAIAAVLAAVAPWFTRSRITDVARDTTLLEVIQGDSFVVYESMVQVWISGLGLVLVLASAIVNSEMRKRFAQAGSVMMLILPGWSLFQVYAGDQDFGAGWGMWAVAVISVAIIILSRMMPDQEGPSHDSTPPSQIGQ